MSVMKQAYAVAARAVRQRLAEQHPEDLRVLDGIRRSQVAVYAGSYDRVEKILKLLNVPFRINPGKRGLRASRIAFVNCSRGYRQRLIPTLAAYVAGGGWLVSSDWALELIVEKAFPNTVRSARGRTGDEVISVEPVLDSLWDEVVVSGADPQWWIEGSSHPIEVLDAGRVRIEAASHDLLRRYRTPAVGVSFDWERGHVFHVISHFWCKHSRAPSARHRGPSLDFLKAGMRLSDEGIAQVFRQARVEPASLNFAQMQSAATATELVAQLCIRAVRNSPAQPPRERRSVALNRNFLLRRIRKALWIAGRVPVFVGRDKRLFRFWVPKPVEKTIRKLPPKSPGKGGNTPCPLQDVIPGNPGDAGRRLFFEADSD